MILNFPWNNLFIYFLIFFLGQLDIEYMLVRFPLFGTEVSQLKLYYLYDWVFFDHVMHRLNFSLLPSSTSSLPSSHSRYFLPFHLSLPSSPSLSYVYFIFISIIIVHPLISFITLASSRLWFCLHVTSISCLLCQPTLIPFFSLAFFPSVFYLSFLTS